MINKALILSDFRNQQFIIYVFKEKENGNARKNQERLYRLCANA